MFLSRWSPPLVLALLVMSGCPAGKDPPTVTTMIGLPETGPAGFRLGAEATSCGGARSQTELDRCDAGKGDEPAAWIDDLTWVPRATATLAAFWIDEHEVTNLQYSHCVEAGKCAEPAYADIEGTAYYGAAEFDDSPVVWVRRKDARDYCAFVGKRLPNEAEWEWAARYDGKNNDRIFPYAADRDPNCSKNNGSYLVSAGCATTPLPIDYSPDDVTFKRVRNMASNVAEWVEDDWNAFSYCEGHTSYPEDCMIKPDPTTCPCAKDGALCAKSCLPERLVLCKAGSYALQKVANATSYVVRGGSYKHGHCEQRLFVRRKETRPAGPELGFRCASSDQPEI